MPSRNLTNGCRILSKKLVEALFNPFQTGPIHPDKTQNLTAHLPIGIESLIFVYQVQTRLF